jgi:Ethanolamine utilization protein EutJ (predicted chaperonin)
LELKQAGGSKVEEEEAEEERKKEKEEVLGSNTFDQILPVLSKLDSVLTYINSFKFFLY